GTHKILGLSMGYAPARPSFMQAAEVDGSAVANVPNPARRSTVVLFGDSVLGNSVDDAASPDAYFHTLLAERWGCTVINCAIGGATLTKNPDDDRYGPFSGSALAKAIR